MEFKPNCQGCGDSGAIMAEHKVTRASWAFRCWCECGLRRYGDRVLRKWVPEYESTYQPYFFGSRLTSDDYTKNLPLAEKKFNF